MTQSAAAKQQTPDLLQMVDTTYFVMLDDEYEKKAAKEYLRQHYPNTNARVVHELRIDRLTDKHTVIALFRGNERTDAVRVVANGQGIRELKPTPLPELAGEVQESKPVRCAEYWQTIEGNEGTLDVASFLTELGKKCTPAAIKLYPAQGFMKLGFA